MDNFHGGDKVNHFNVILSDVPYVFVVIGLFIYLPALVILNFANWIVINSRKPINKSNYYSVPTRISLPPKKTNER